MKRRILKRYQLRKDTKNVYNERGKKKINKNDILVS